MWRIDHICNVFPQHSPAHYMTSQSSTILRRIHGEMLKQSEMMMSEDERGVSTRRGKFSDLFILLLTVSMSNTYSPPPSLTCCQLYVFMHFKQGYELSHCYILFKVATTVLKIYKYGVLYIFESTKLFKLFRF